MNGQPVDPVHFGRVVFVMDQMTKRIRFLEHAITLMIFALFLMTSCNVMIILKVFFMRSAG
jgi:hypothetical protein